MPPVLVKRLLLQRAGNEQISNNTQFTAFQFEALEKVLVPTFADTLTLSPYAGIFALPQITETPLRLDLNDFRIVTHSRDTNISEELRIAEKLGAQGVVLKVSPQWVPNRGITEFKMPVLAVTGEIDVDNVKVKYKPPQTTGFELFVPGTLPAEEIVVGTSTGSPVFYKLAAAIRSLQRDYNWKPLRSIRFIRYPQFTAAQYADKQSRRRRPLAYLTADTSPNTISGTPELQSLLKTALHEFEDVGIPMPELASAPQLKLGEAHWALQQLVPTLSVNTGDARVTAQLLAYLLASLSEEPVLPFAMSPFIEFLPITDFRALAKAFDDTVSQTSFNFTSEFPWYQWPSKLHAIAQRKRANFAMVQIEPCAGLPDQQDFLRHMLFTSDQSWTDTEVRSIPLEHRYHLQLCLNEVSHRII